MWGYWLFFYSQKGTMCMITRNKRRFDVENAMQGTDCFIFEIICKRNVTEFEEVELINEHGRSYGTIKSERVKK